MQSTKPKLILVVPPALKEAVEAASKARGCSQAEVVKSALYAQLQEYMKDYGSKPLWQKQDFHGNLGRLLLGKNLKEVQNGRI